MQYSRENVIKGFRELADLLESRPDLPIDKYGSDYDKNKRADPAITIEVYCSKDEFYQAAHNIGKGEKDSTDYYFYLDRRFGDGAICLRYETSRETVCERKVVGKKTRVVAARPAEDERVIEEDVYEYECSPLLTGFGSGKDE